MGEIPYKLQAKLGPSEFTAEGPEDSVRADYQDFLKTVRETIGPMPQRNAVFSAIGVAGTGTITEPLLPPGPNLMHTGREVLDRVYQQDGDMLTLRHLPSTPTKAADSAILLMYGYKLMQRMDDVPIMKLNESLRRSGLNFERLDRELVVHQALYRKGGQKNGARLSLNNQGVLQAEQWLKAWD